MAHQILWHVQPSYSRKYVNQVFADSADFHRAPPLPEIYDTEGNVISTEDDSILFEQIEAHGKAHDVLCTQYEVKIL